MDGALYQAAENGHEAEVRLLLEHKADVDTKTISRKTALLSGS
jgi:ankyrin repeat protein